MTKSIATVVLAALIQGILSVPAHAGRSAPKPWLSLRSGDSAPVARAKPRRVAKVKAPRKVVKKEPDIVISKSSGHGKYIAEQAQRYSGTRYRFGGDSKSKGFDCSGLIRRVYNDLNLKKVPRTSSELYRMGDPVGMNDLRPGDLVFFKNTYKRGISHVGVYAGRNRFVHAQNSRSGVTSTSLAEPYYQLHYAGARRLY